MTTALKEWDTQAQALATGQTAVILRKGGILETHGGFEVEHRQFWLYPTFLHQNAAELRPGFQSQLRADPQPGVIALPARAEVQDVYKIEVLEQALSLEDMQALNAAAIERRFFYRQRPWLHALVLKVTPLLQPAVLSETPEMLGCLSWVPLADEITAPLAAPALSDSELLAVRDAVRGRLAG